MKKKAFLSIAAIILFYSISTPAFGKITKGPYVIFDGIGDRVVKVQSGEKELFVETELSDGATRSIKMKGLPGEIFEAKLPDGASRFRILNKNTIGAWSALAPEPRNGRAYRIIVYGDDRTGLGSRKVHRELVSLMNREAPSAVINTGDLVASGNSEYLWDAFFDDAEPIMGGVPYVAVIGNHDVSDYNWFRRYFRSDVDKRYIIFPFGRGWIILLDSIGEVNRDDEQYRFLMDALKNAEGSSPIIVVMHEPPFSWGRHGSHQAVIDTWVPLFEKYGVDLVLGGHDHDYQRIGPINGVNYIVTGGGGAPIYGVQSNQDLKKALNRHHFVLLEMDEGLIRGWIKDKDGNVLDNFEFNLKGGR